MSEGASVGVLFPARAGGPLRAVLQRLLIALGLLLLTVLIVWIGRSGYRDSGDIGSGEKSTMSLLDCFYYATVSLSTTGYGDITPVTDSARLVNTLLVTPLRIAFLVVLVGTTLEVLTRRTRDQYRLSRWRTRVDHHVIVVGYGTKGRSAVRTLIDNGTPAEEIVVVDSNHRRAGDATEDGLVSVAGDATQSDVLRRARIDRARHVVVVTDRDDASVLVTLTARQLNRSVTIAAAAREAENAPLLRQSGADSVVVSADAAGRLLALTAVSPHVSEVIDDLMVYGAGLEVAEREVGPGEVGRSPRDVDDLVVAVVRRGALHHFYEPEVGMLRAGDRLIVVRRSLSEQGGG